MSFVRPRAAELSGMSGVDPTTHDGRAGGEVSKRVAEWKEARLREYSQQLSTVGPPGLGREVPARRAVLS